MSIKPEPLVFVCLQPSGKGKRLPEVHCVVSKLGCFNLFAKVKWLVDGSRLHSNPPSPCRLPIQAFARRSRAGGFAKVHALNPLEVCRRAAPFETPPVYRGRNEAMPADNPCQSLGVFYKKKKQEKTTSNKVVCVLPKCPSAARSVSLTQR